MAVITQLLTSLQMAAPSPDEKGNWYFTVHEYSGLAAFAFVFGFWLAVCLRRKGIRIGLLFPWFSGARIQALWNDICAHAVSLFRLHLPSYEEDAPLAAAVHGLGLLLMTTMATTGTIYYAFNTGNPDAGGLIGIIMLVHTTLANFVWAYLIGHASVAVIYHFAGQMRLGKMWSARADAS